MLIYPLGYYLDDEYQFFIENNTISNILYNDLVYYSSKIGGSNSIPFYTGDASYSISWLYLNNTLYNKQAQYFFDYGLLHIDNEYFYIWIEEYNNANGGHLNFMTGAGTFLQNIVYGYAGFKITKDFLYINPILPYQGNITKITFNSLEYKSVQFTFNFNDKIMEFKRIDNNTSALKIYIQTLSIDYNNKDISVNATLEMSSKAISLNIQQVRLSVT